VRRLSGQAVRHTGRLLHWIATAALTVTVLLTVAVIAAAWRLSRGPVDLSWLTHRIEAAAEPTRITVGTTALAWEGFREGIDRPLDLRLTDVSVTAPDGMRLLDVPRAAVSLSIGNLFLGRLVPRAVELDGARLTLERATDGSLSLDLGGDATAAEATPLSAILGALARPVNTDQTATGGVLSQLQRVRIRDATVVVQDHQLGATWRAPRADIDLTRRTGGGVDGAASLALALGDQTANLTVSAELGESAQTTHLRARLSPVAPAALARVAPALAPLAALDAPVGLEAALDLDATLQPTQGRLTAQIGAGQAQIGTGSVPIHGAVLVAAGTPALITVETAHIELQGHDGGPLSTLQASGSVRRGAAGGISATAVLSLDQVAFADLGRLWPAGTGGGARPWILQNITAGVARNAHVTLGLEASSDLSGMALTQAGGTIDADGLTVSWLRPVPPIEQGQAQLRILDPDTVEIVAQSGHQRVRGSQPGLTIRNGRMRITGLAGRDQVGSIDAEIAGPVASVITLLKEPRLHLLDHQPIDLKDPAGDLTGTLTVRLPLEDKVRMDDIAIHAATHLTGVHLTGLVADRDLDKGELDLDATNDGLTVKGHALLAGMDADLDAAMDFRAGPPTQVVERASVTGRPGAGQLTAAGLDTGGALFGEVGLAAVLTERRNGEGEVAVDADLGQATVVAAPLGWRKPVGMATKASAGILLAHDRLSSIDRFTMDGDGVLVRGSARCVDGRIESVTVDRAVLGDTDLHATVRLPAGGPIQADLAGPMLDLSAKLTGKTPKKAKPKTPPPPGPAWSGSARFDRVKLAGGVVASGLVAQGVNDGTVFRSLSVTGATAPGAPFQVSIGSAAGARRVTVTVGDAGALLRGLDLVRTMENGRLVLTGSYDDANPWHPLEGSAEIDDFRLRGAPWLAKLLQAMTLYGVVDVLKGPGVGFAKLVAPFRLDQDGLLLNDARAFSPSLGITAKGRLDVDTETVDMQGTIVPAYFFNSLLGNIPLVGKLFSPERGGGVFAARYAMKGPLDDPAVSVNPLSALTPGFLRDVFGIF
jgi:hypothetical protein